MLVKVTCMTFFKTVPDLSRPVRRSESFLMHSFFVASLEACASGTNNYMFTTVPSVYCFMADNCGWGNKTPNLNPKPLNPKPLSLLSGVELPTIGAFGFGAHYTIIIRNP